MILLQVPAYQEAVSMNITDPAWVSGQVWDPEYHGKLLVAVAACGDLHHDALAAFHEKRCDEHEEDVIEEESTQEDSADLETGKTENFEHVYTEHDAEDVLQYPGPVGLPEHEPCGGGGNRG